ncbi:MAG: hypothetical protein ACHREM_32100 [Polyangiales bacterium]
MGREWNAKLGRRLGDSIVRAGDNKHVARLLVTDLEESSSTLVEVLDEDNRVIGEFLVRPSSRPEKLRYREETGWPQ